VTLARPASVALRALALGALAAAPAHAADPAPQAPAAAQAPQGPELAAVVAAVTALCRQHSDVAQCAPLLASLPPPAAAPAPAVAAPPPALQTPPPPETHATQAEKDAAQSALAKAARTTGSPASAALGPPGSAGLAPASGITGVNIAGDTSSGKVTLTLNRDILHYADGQSPRLVASGTFAVTLPKSDQTSQLSAIDANLPAKSLNLRLTWLLNDVGSKLQNEAQDYADHLDDRAVQGRCLAETRQLAELIAHYGLFPHFTADAKGVNAMQPDPPKQSEAYKAFFSDDDSAYTQLRLAYDGHATTPHGTTVTDCSSSDNDTLITLIYKATQTKYPSDAKSLAVVEDQMTAIRIGHNPVDNTPLAGAALPPPHFVPVYALSVDGTLGYTNYAYYNPTTLASGSAAHAIYAVGGDFWAVPWQQWSFDAGYHHTIGYKAGSLSNGKQETLCLNAATPTLTCQTGYFGAPTSQLTNDIDAELRWLPHRPAGRLRFRCQSLHRQRAVLCHRRESGRGVAINRRRRSRLHQQDRQSHRRAVRHHRVLRIHGGVMRLLNVTSGGDCRAG